MVEKFEPPAVAFLLPLSLREPLVQANHLLDECLGMGEAAQDRDSEALYQRLVGAFDARHRLQECLDRNDDELKAVEAESVYSEVIWFSSKHRFVLDESLPLLWSVAAALAKAESRQVAPRITRKRVAAHLELLRKVILEQQTWSKSMVSSLQADLEREAYRAYARRLVTGRTYSVDSEEEALENLEGSELIVDEARFAVYWDDRAPCELGHTRQFRFFKALAETPKKYVDCEEIAERMGSDANAERLAPIKRRLVMQLEDVKYGHIADCIESKIGHYGLFFEGAIKMKS